MDEMSFDLAIGALERFVAFAETLTPAELDALTALGGSDDGDVEGFGQRWGTASGMGDGASFEHMIGLSSRLAQGDHASSLASMRSQLEELKASKSNAYRWPP